jgi:hypothetical protein
VTIRRAARLFSPALSLSVWSCIPLVAFTMQGPQSRPAFATQLHAHSIHTQNQKYTSCCFLEAFRTICADSITLYPKEQHCHCRGVTCLLLTHFQIRSITALDVVLILAQHRAAFAPFYQYHLQMGRCCTCQISAVLVSGVLPLFMA